MVAGCGYYSQNYETMAIGQVGSQGHGLCGQYPEERSHVTRVQQVNY